MLELSQEEDMMKPLGNTKQAILIGLENATDTTVMSPGQMTGSPF